MDRRYQQFCPVAKAAEVLTRRWTPLVVRELMCGSTRFNDIRRGVPRMSANLLSQRLKELEETGVVIRSAGANGDHAIRLWGPSGLRPRLSQLAAAQRSPAWSDRPPASPCHHTDRRLRVSRTTGGFGKRVA